MLYARVSCPVCGKGFQFNSFLQRHMKTHTGERSFTCPSLPCQLTFKRNDHLKRHFKKAHMGQVLQPPQNDGGDGQSFTA